MFCSRFKKRKKIVFYISSDLPHVALHNISSLETLSLSNNILTSFDFLKLNGLPNLRHLNADDNVLSSVGGFGAVNLSRLASVDLSGNILMDLPKSKYAGNVCVYKF